MARIITNYEKYQNRIIEILKNPEIGTPSIGCLYQELIGGTCPSTGCDTCKSLLVEFLEGNTKRSLSEKEIMFCRIVETGFIERRNDGHLCLIKDAGNGYSIASDITFLELFEWLEVSDRRFDIRGYLNSYETEIKKGN